VLALLSAYLGFGATNSFVFSYTNREALLADGWSFIATTPTGTQRDTEVTNGAAISYDQQTHPGVLRIPADVGDLWGALNNTRNSLFRTLPTNWLSLQLDVSFAPNSDVQQVQLALYQDDDNYIEVGHAYVASFGGEVTSLVQEDSGLQASWSPRSISRRSVNVGRLQLRLDRVLGSEQVLALYSLDQTNWTTLGSAWEYLVNPQICIWVSDSGGRLPTCDLRQLDIVTRDLPVLPMLVAQPQHLVFNAVAGQAYTNRQQLRVVTRRSASSQVFAVSSSAPWLLALSAVTNTPGFCDVGVDTTGVDVGTYQGTITVSAPGFQSAQTTVTLIVNPAVRVQVANWRGAKAGAMTVWVDDSYLSGFEELSTNGFQGTYLLWGETSQRYGFASMSTVPPQFADYARAGMELGCHTVDHWYEKLISETALRFEIETNIAAVLAKTPQASNTLVSFAFPGGVAPVNYRVIAADYYLSIHGYNQNQLEDPDPYDYLFLKCFNSHEHTPYPPSDFKALVDAAVAQGKWYNMVLHGYNNTDGAIAYAKGKDIWVGTGGAVTKYILLRQRTCITNYHETAGGQIAFSYSRLPLDASALRSFETAFVPQDRLTFQVDLTGSNAAFNVQVDGLPVAATARVVGGRTFTLFDAEVTTNAHAVVLQAVANRAPTLPTLLTQTVNQFATLVVTNAAFDPDVPFQTLAYRLLNAPAGAQVDGQGVVSWTPDAIQGPGTYAFTMVASDNGSPSLSVTNSFDVQVLPQLWLVLPSLSAASLTAGQTLTVTNTAIYTRPLSPWFTNTVFFNYTNRSALLADGWSFYATTPGQGARNTEVTNGAVVSYDQTAHPGVLRVPCDIGDLWAGNNSSRNALFRSLPTNWTSVRVGLGFAPSRDVQQVQLAVYKDDDNYVQAGLAYNNAGLGGQAATVIFENNAQPVNAFVSLSGVTNIFLRLDRPVGGSRVTASFSLNNATWTTVGSYYPAFAGPSLSLWTGGAPVAWSNGLPTVDLQRLDVVVSNSTSLTYALLNPPPGATIDANGVIHWTPVPDQPPGTYTLTTTVTDQPPVGTAVSATNSFTVTVSSPSVTPLITAVSRKPDGSIAVVGAGVPDRLYLIQASTNLVNWTTVSTNMADANGAFSFTDTDAPVYPARYYRFVAP
jgi:peptidoglycan/xylan/chitin deacetylase (PgdA/CDA1 family)